ncbi:MAG: DUF5666 domain-containing protein [Chloroflexota bacterium]
MKKSSVLILVIVIAFALVIPVAAKGPGTGGNGPGVPFGGQGTMAAYTQAQQGPRQIFAMVGTIESIDPVLKTLTIKVIKGNKLVQASKGKSVTVITDNLTRYLRKTGTAVIPISFDDLREGDRVSVNGVYLNSTWKANRITVGAFLTQMHKK